MPGKQPLDGLLVFRLGDSFRQMTDDLTATFYLHPKLRKQAEAGKHNFIKRVSDVLTASGMRVALDNDDPVARMRALGRPGRGLFLMDEPVDERSLTFRKTYLYPFWHIEKQAKRWDWPVAKADFDPGAVDHQKAANFQRFWRQRLLKGQSKEVRSDGFVYVPLQGRLLEQRSFQSCSPIEMIRHVLTNDRERFVVVTLHPSEVYRVEELKALEEVLDDNDRIYVRKGGTDQYLRHCDYVVTQNSGAGFMGYFFDKPLILFGKSDFHHIALNVANVGVSDAFAAVAGHAPHAAAYLYWFLQEQAINAGRPEAQQKIQAVLRNHGWPV